MLVCCKCGLFLQSFLRFRGSHNSANFSFNLIKQIVEIKSIAYHSESPLPAHLAHCKKFHMKLFEVRPAFRQGRISLIRQ